MDVDIGGLLAMVVETAAGVTFVLGVAFLVSARVRARRRGAGRVAPLSSR